MRKIWNWIRVDGLLHIETSALTFLTIDSFSPLWVANTANVAIGIGKEIYDKVTKKGCAEWHDIACDAIGLAIGNAIGITYHFVGR